MPTQPLPGVYPYETATGETRWRISFDAPPAFDPETGKVRRRQTTRRGFTGVREANRALREALAAVETATHVDHRTDSLGGYLLSWLEGIDVRDTTAASFDQQIRLRILPYDIAGKRLQEVTVEDLNRLYRYLEKEGSVKGGPLAPKSVRKVHEVLNMALGEARRNGYVVRNVAEDARRPKLKRTEMRVWTADQLRTFLAYVSDDHLYALWLLIATTGLRRGEGIGLRWDDVDLDAGTILIRRNRTMSDGKVVEHEEPKTSAGHRRIALDAETVAALRRHRARQNKDRMAAGSTWQDHGVVFCWPDGRRLHPNSTSKAFRRLSEAGGLDPIKLHELRHTYATIALSSGEPITVVSRRLGHASVSITLDVYSHVLPTDDRDTASRVASLILGA